MELPCSCFYCLVYLRNIFLYHMTKFKDQHKLYDNVIIKLDKKRNNQTHKGVLSSASVSILCLNLREVLSLCIHPLSNTTQHNE